MVTRGVTITGATLADRLRTAAAILRGGADLDADARCDLAWLIDEAADLLPEPQP